WIHEQLVSISVNKEARNSEGIHSIERENKEKASAVEQKRKGKEIERKIESNSENQTRVNKMKISELERNKIEKLVPQEITVSSTKTEKENSNKTNCNLYKNELNSERSNLLKSFMLWDLPNQISNRQIVEIVRNIGRVREVQVRHRRNNKTRAEIVIEMSKEKFLEITESIWSLFLNNGKLTRLTPSTNKQRQVLSKESYLAGDKKDIDINSINRENASKESTRRKKLENNSHKVSQEDNIQIIEMSEIRRLLVNITNRLTYIEKERGSIPQRS
ncbi:4036_t:CDS:2, partial [Gigaspora margarita]